MVENILRETCHFLDVSVCTEINVHSLKNKLVKFSRHSTFVHPLTCLIEISAVLLHTTLSCCPHNHILKRDLKTRSSLNNDLLSCFCEFSIE